MENRKTKDLRIAIYSPDGLGFGYMLRICSIAWQIYQGFPEASFPTFSDPLSGQFFPSSANFGFIKLPSTVKAGPRNCCAAHLCKSFPKIPQLRQQLIGNMLLRNAPHIFSADHRFSFQTAYRTQPLRPPQPDRSSHNRQFTVGSACLMKKAGTGSTGLIPLPKIIKDGRRIQRLTNKKGMDSLLSWRS